MFDNYLKSVRSFQDSRTRGSRKALVRGPQVASQKKRLGMQHFKVNIMMKMTIKCVTEC